MTRAWNHALRHSLMAIMLALGSTSATAGLVDGPYLIWMNLADDETANSAIHDYIQLDGHTNTCWNSRAILINDNLPDGLTPALVQKAVVARDALAKRRVLTILKRGDGDIEGFDGVIVVVKGAKPTLLSIDARGKVRSQAVVVDGGQPNWADAFCGVKPPIYRKP